MENNELSNRCDFCDELLQHRWFAMKACRHEGANVIAEYRWQLCATCYPKVHYPLRTAAFELMRQCFQQAHAKLMQELRQSVGLDTGQKP